jgi:hypothetical protein
VVDVSCFAGVLNTGLLAIGLAKSEPMQGGTPLLPLHRKAGNLAMAKIITTITGDYALTFDDVLLQPARSDILPGETDISTHFLANPGSADV